MVNATFKKEQGALAGELASATLEANAADAAFDAALVANGFRSRWDWQRWQGGEWLQSAYRRKINADERVHAAHTQQRDTK